jgi:osmotically inducible protein OsmC
VPIRKSEAEWQGNLKEGKGSLKLGSGAFSGSYSFPSRFESGTGSNPEELIAAAHASCFSMALSHGLASAGHTPKRVHTVASVHLEKGETGFGITLIQLETDAEVPGIDNAKFQEEAEKAKKNCPISKALASVKIELKARLV